MSNVDWLHIKNEYVTTDISYRRIAEKHGVSFNTLKDRALKEGWQKERTSHRNKVATKIQQKAVTVAVNAEVNRTKRILAISDKLIDKIEQAADQVDNYIVSNKTKIKTTVRGGKSEDGKASPTVEKTEETERLEIVGGIIDRLGLKHISGALKDLKEVQLSLEAESKPANTELMEALLAAVQSGANGGNDGTV